jgi:hypothetical protein
VTDNYGIQWVSGVGTTWQASFDSNSFLTPNLGWNEGDLPNLGAECNATDASASTFNMYSTLTNTSWNAVSWPHQAPAFIPTPPTLFNGVSYSNGEWSWNTK